MEADAGAEALTGAAEMAATAAADASRTDLIRVILAAGMVPVLALVGAGLAWAGLPTSEWSVLVVGPTVSVVVGFVLSGRSSAVARAGIAATVVNAAAIVTTRLDTSAAILASEHRQEAKNGEAPRPALVPPSAVVDDPAASTA
jgi:hypothetical protein